MIKIEEISITIKRIIEREPIDSNPASVTLVQASALMTVPIDGCLLIVEMVIIVAMIFKIMGAPRYVRNGV